MTSSRTTFSLLGTIGAAVFTGVGVLQTIDPTFPGAPGVQANLAGACWGMIWLALGVALLAARQRTVSGALSNER